MLRTASEIREQIEKVKAQREQEKRRGICYDVYEEIDYSMYLADLFSELDDAERLEDILDSINNARNLYPNHAVIAIKETYHGMSAYIGVLGRNYCVRDESPSGEYTDHYVGTDKETAARVYMEVFDQILEEG